MVCIRLGDDVMATLIEVVSSDDETKSDSYRLDLTYEEVIGLRMLLGGMNHSEARRSMTHSSVYHNGMDIHRYSDAIFDDLYNTLSRGISDGIIPRP